ncbi:DUF6452 family protein [Snuella lapsa]|uniref:DUF6452 family protein n=1 Tax=Snuella lapsa TaxID=870481 RepID=A0ABP6YH69_9FLAO
MKKLSLLILLAILTAHTGCERDDICPGSTPTTPHLIIDVFDFENQESKKNIFNLVVAKGTESTILPGYAFESKNNLVLPLDTKANTTQYRLIKNAKVNDNGTPDDTSDDVIEGNYDVLTINYSREEIYVSRACGYKTIFQNVTLTIEDDGDNWILSQQALNPNQSVEDETTTHFNIYH